MQYQNQLSCGKFLPTFCPLRIASQHSHPCTFTSIGRRCKSAQSIIIDFGDGVVYLCWLCDAHAVLISMHQCYHAQSSRPPGKDWDSYPGLALRGLLQGRAPGPEVQYWMKGGFWNLWFIQMNERFSCMPGKLMKTVEEGWVLRDFVL